MAWKTKELERAYRKKYRELHYEEIRQKNKIYKRDNKEKIKISSKKYWERNKETIRKRDRLRYGKEKEKRRISSKKYREKNREKIILERKQYYKKNKKEINNKNKIYRENNKNIANKYRRERLKTDIQFKISCYLRSRIWAVLKNKNRHNSVIKELGCSIEYLKKYLEQQFQEGMSWNNWSINGWSIDHQIPLSIVDLTDRESFKHVCHYTNLQPMWADENNKKKNKITR